MNVHSVGSLSYKGLEGTQLHEKYTAPMARLVFSKKS